MEKNRAILIITDGIGHNAQCDNNAFCNAVKPTYEYLFEHVPYSMIKTSGLAVGLPEGQMGNSEVGHMSIGSGRILYQNLVKITKAIEDGTIEQNSVLKNILDRSSNIHIVGLLSDGGVHSHIDHIKSLAKIASKRDKRVYLHLITDGRDVDTLSSLIYIKEIEKILDKNITIATVSGRFYTMDRDKRWDRVKRGYEAIVSANPQTSISPLEYISLQHQNSITDEFIEPQSFNGYKGIKDGDGVIFANFRNDRMREIVDAIGRESFNEFQRDFIKVNIATMTEYNRDFTYPIIFESKPPKNTLAEVISQAGLKQFHTSETEKYAHVTFFLNGGIEEPFVNETRVLVPSPDVKTYDLKPEMSAKEVSQHVQRAIKEEYDFIVVNFANGDMVGHTGNYEAAVKAVEAVDKEIGDIIEVAKQHQYNLIITSDHGNCEQMRDKDGKILTNHTTFDVYCFIISSEVKSVKSGRLSNIAPTILKLMKLKTPQEMDEPLI